MWGQTTVPAREIKLTIAPPPRVKVRLTARSRGQGHRVALYTNRHKTDKTSEYSPRGSTNLQTADKSHSIARGSQCTVHVGGGCARAAGSGGAGAGQGPRHVDAYTRAHLGSTTPYTSEEEVGTSPPCPLPTYHALRLPPTTPLGSSSSESPRRCAGILLRGSRPPTQAWPLGGA